MKFAGWITAVFQTMPVKTEEETGTVQIEAELYQDTSMLVGDHPDLWSSVGDFVKDAARDRLLECKKEG